MKNVHSQLGRALLLAAVMFGSSEASAEGAAGPRWACWYEAGNQTIQCVLGRTPTSSAEARAADVEAKIDRRLSPLVQTIWGSPEQLAGNQIAIPLWNTPTEMEFAHELAQSVMCGMRADCSVNFDANPDGRAPIRAALLQSGADEAEVMAEVRAAQAQLLAARAAAEEPRRTTRRRRV